jgi:predicted ferric reductase
LRYVAGELTFAGAIHVIIFSQNLQTSINSLLDLADGMYRRIGQGEWSTVTPDTFPEAQKAFADLGLSFPEFIDMVNVYIKSLKTARTKIAQTLLFVACVTFHVRTSKYKFDYEAWPLNHLFDFFRETGI